MDEDEKQEAKYLIAGLVILISLLVAIFAQSKIVSLMGLTSAFLMITIGCGSVVNGG